MTHVAGAKRAAMAAVSSSQSIRHGYAREQSRHG
jgi:hypothetical protein